MSKLGDLANTALSQAEGMLNFAQEGNWAALEELQRKHTLVVNEIALTSVDVDEEIDAQAIQETLRQVKKLNIETSALAEAHQQTLVTEQKTKNKAAKMQKALDGLG